MKTTTANKSTCMTIEPKNFIPHSSGEEDAMAQRYILEWECDQHNISEIEAMDKRHLVDEDGKPLRGKVSKVKAMEKLPSQWKKAYESAIKWWKKQQTIKKPYERYGSHREERTWLKE